MATAREIRLARTVRLKESKERFVNLCSYTKEIFVDLEETSKKAQGIGNNECYVRETAAKRIIEAQRSLPEGLHLKIIDGYRPLSAQRKVYRQVFEEQKKKHPEWTAKQIELETDNWVANPDKVVPPHSTGGTLDLTIADRNGKELDMGTGVNAVDLKRSKTNSRFISKRARANRKILIDAMSSAGFVNNRLEWWHWSYGDWRWALAKKRYAIYGPK